MSDIESKYFVRAFLRFLQKQITERQFSADIVESLEVASQCLETAYNLPSASGGGQELVDNAQDLDDTHPLAYVDTYELFQNSCCDVGPARRLEAENVKNEGNGLMKEEKYHDALLAYNRAISLDATNPVFYCNRAAAYSRLGDYQRAADDCKMSLRYDPAYSKAYGRLGIAYSKLNKHQLALDAYNNALRLDPDNVDYQNNMSVTQQRLEEAANTTDTAGGGSNGIGGLNFGGLAGFPSIGNIDLGAALSNPEILNLAQRMMADPSMQEMVSSIRDTNNMDAILQNGRQLVSHLRNYNPDFFDSISQHVNSLAEQRGGNTGGTNNDDDITSNPPSSSQKPQQPPPQ